MTYSTPHKSNKSLTAVILTLALTLIINAKVKAQYSTNWSPTTTKLVTKVKKNGGSNYYWYKNAKWVPIPKESWTTVKHNALKNNLDVNQKLVENGKLVGQLIVHINKKGLVVHADFLEVNHQDSNITKPILAAIKNSLFIAQPNGNPNLTDPFITYFQLSGIKELAPKALVSVPDSPDMPWKLSDTALQNSINKIEAPKNSNIGESKIKDSTKTSKDIALISALLKDSNTAKEYITKESKIATRKAFTDSNYIQARFFGGEEAFKNLIVNEFNYPSRCMEKGISGSIIIRFRVNREGVVDKLSTVSKSPQCPEFTTEAKRVIVLAPWIPATYKGKVVNCWLEIPIKLDVR
ncbi:MAG: energy transducer TonB [Bacteroidota bacterium]